MDIIDKIMQKYNIKVSLNENNKINNEKINIIYNSQLTYDKNYSNINNCNAAQKRLKTS